MLDQACVPPGLEDSSVSESVVKVAAALDNVTRHDSDVLFARSDMTSQCTVVKLAPDRPARPRFAAFSRRLWRLWLISEPLQRLETSIISLGVVVRSCPGAPYVSILICYMETSL